MHKKAAMLEDRGVVQVGGDDASSFLQGLLTNDVERLPPGEASYAALLSPQGKILFDMLVVRAPPETGAAFLLDCAAAQAADLTRRLGFYKLRARVSIVDESGDRRVVANWGAEPENAPDALFYADPRDPRIGWRAILPSALGVAVGQEHIATYEALRIGAGVPRGGVDFAKGCYVGQEVVSRMKHRGAARKRVERLKLLGEPPPPGTPVLDGELPVGTLGSSSGREALAMLRLDRVEDANAAGRALSAGGVSLRLAD